MPAVQNTNIRATMEKLEVAPPSADLPQVDPKQLVWTVNTDPAWLGLMPIAIRAGNVDINGASATLVDNGSGVALTSDQNPIVVGTQGRYYQAIRIQLNGASVSPILIGIGSRYLDPNGTLRDYYHLIEDMTNPSQIVFGPLYVPPLVLMFAQTFVNGGAGDTVTFAANGLSHEIGTSIPMFPASVFHSSV